jgi:4-hydroxybenzoate polyprenyltransferase
MADHSPPLPLYVDLDGTLYPGDTLWDSAALLLRTQPTAVFSLVLQCLAGPASLKCWMAEKIVPDATLLPYRVGLIDRCRTERSSGRRVVLATAAHSKIAHAVAAHLGCFDAVIATDSVNMKGARKLLAIQEDAMGPFWYAGDSVADLPIWKAASGAIVTGPAAAWQDDRVPTSIVGRILEDQSRMRAFLKALRPHQWVKNLLVFLPLLAAHRVSSAADWQITGLTFIAFCLCASSVYLFNDLVDIENDRSHARKRRRPFAAATLPIAVGLISAPLLFVLAMVLAWLASPAAALVLLVYYLSTVAYSFDLKRRVLVDVFVLTGLYGLRVVAGAVAVDVPLSPWLMAFTAFFFLSLALGKRAAELHGLQAIGGSGPKGRGWRPADLPFVTAAGIAAAFSAALVVGLYVTGTTAQGLYERPIVLWGVIPLILWWCCRVWLKASRGELNEDPVIFAVRDAGSWLMAALVLSLFLAAGPRAGP